jgi:hypothetical protein
MTCEYAPQGALFVVGGFPLAPADVPWVLQWLRYISPFAFAYDSFVASQLAAGAAGQVMVVTSELT